MGYLPTGDVSSTAMNVAKVGLAVVQDPALGQVADLLNQLVAIENDGKGGDTDAGGYTSTTKGIGLKYAVTPLKLAIRIRKDPWLVPLVAGGLVASIFALGVATGRPNKRGA